MTKGTERYLPWLLTLLITALFSIFRFYNLCINNGKEIFILFATSTVTLVGFFVTVMSILIGLIDKVLIKKIIKLNRWHDTLIMIYHPIVIGILFILMNIILVMFDISVLNQTMLVIFKLLFAFVGLLFTFTSIRIVYIFVLLMHQIPNEDKHLPGKIKDSDIVIDNKDIPES